MQNKSQMIVEFLGTGTSQGVPVIQCRCKVCVSKNPKDKRFRSSVSVKKGDTSIIIDVGPDFRQQMLRTDINHLDAVLLTHEHNDHIAGMDDLRPYNYMQKSDIPVLAQKRVIDDLKVKYHYAFTEKRYPGAPGYDIREIEDGSQFSFNDLQIQAFGVMHGKLPILSYRINDFVYITDAKTISPKSMEVAYGADVLVLNALRIEPHWSHLTLDEAVEMAEKLQSKKTYFTHMSHLLGLHEEVEKRLPENVFLAYDGLNLCI